MYNVSLGIYHWGYHWMYDKFQNVGTITPHSMGQKSVRNSTENVFCQCRHSWPWHSVEIEFVDTDLASWEAWSLFHCISVIGQWLKCLKITCAVMGMERGPIQIKGWILALTKFIILNMTSKSIPVCCESHRFFFFFFMQWFWNCTSDLWVVNRPMMNEYMFTVSELFFAWGETLCFIYL